MSDLVWFFLSLPVVTMAACMMDIDEYGSVRHLFHRGLRWNLMFMVTTGLYYQVWYGW